MLVYKTIPELAEYILIHQKQILVEQFQRKSENLWIPTIYQAQDRLYFNSIDFYCPIENLNLYENLDQLL
ncbi:MAG: hypothetical protein VKJ02_12430 [Snowella sp.]|nr:hypothetical protein [Snowella sp.]